MKIWHEISQGMLLIAFIQDKECKQAELTNLPNLLVSVPRFFVIVKNVNKY